MVQLRWMITDALENISIEEFNSEWVGINGYFEIKINNQILGFCPHRKLLLDEEGNEDILYWLTKLSDGIIKLNNGIEYEIQLLSMNLTKIILKKDDELNIYFVKTNTKEIIWSEQVILKEFYKEIILNIEKFVTEIQNINIDIVNARMIHDLVNLKKSLQNIMSTQMNT